MPAQLTIAVSSRALFELEDEHAVFEAHGHERYAELQAERERAETLPGPAFGFVRAVAQINAACDPLDPLLDMVVVSRNGPFSGLRFLNAVRSHDLGATRSVMTGGADIVERLRDMGVDLYLTRSPADAEAAAKAGIAVALMSGAGALAPFDGELRIAFDGDAVLFDDLSEAAFEAGGYAGWSTHEDSKADEELGPGPMAAFARKISRLKPAALAAGLTIRLAFVTARDGNSRIRPLNTLRRWGVDLDEAYFLGNMDKATVMKSFKPHLFLDDRPSNVLSVSRVAPSGLVPRLRSRISEAAEEPDEALFPAPR